ncbi:hypothetical protein C8R48DRAFT_711897 [Suillus tomentosus]|nr:hypothetical protein C8R48DRAFT_711897 [Suillus tomentosus]
MKAPAQAIVQESSICCLISGGGRDSEFETRKGQSLDVFLLETASFHVSYNDKGALVQLQW